MKNEKNNCNKYEGLFIFSTENELKKHINECEYCKAQYEKHLKISSLVKEVAPLYLEKEEKKKMLFSVKRLACCLIVFIGLSIYLGYNVYDDYTYQINLQQESIVSDMGLPIDEYGFLSL